MSLADRSGSYRADSSRGGARRDSRQTNDELSMVKESASVEQMTEGATEQEASTIGFVDLGLGAEILQSIEAMGYEEPTPIQVKTIPVMITGADVIAQAQTGSGKTAAFGLPIIEGIDTNLRAVQALILAPTRELAIQVADALTVLGRHRRVETLPIYGGQPYEKQFRGLMRGPHIVVGTPGRVMDHMRRDTLKLDNLKYFVLDEADEMLDMGFVDDIEWVLQQAPAERQTALFSATMPPRIADLAGRYMRSPERISVVGREMTAPMTSQYAYEIPRQRKIDALTRILDAEMPTSAMIFCRTKAGVDELGESLLSRGYPVETLHGDLSQAQRDRVMRRFRSGQAEILIATDVAARGLDIKGVSHVFNYDIPESPEAYVHRIGRTGRAGLEGIAITLITPRETRWLRQIERIVRSTIEMKRLPTLADVAAKRRELLLDQLREALSDDSGIAQYTETIETLVTEEHDPKMIAAAVLKLYAEETGRTADVANAHDDLASFSNPRPQMPMPAGGFSGEGPVRLFINVGRFQGIRPQDIVGAIANEANIPGRAIGQIDIFDNFSFVDVPAQVAEQVIVAIGSSGIKGRAVNVEVASAEHGPAGGPRPTRGGPRREGGGFNGPRRDGGGYRGPRRDGGGGNRFDGPRDR
jgi:ATP-dependent RNA helicase DeaD